MTTRSPSLCLQGQINLYTGSGPIPFETTRYHLFRHYLFLSPESLYHLKHICKVYNVVRSQDTYFGAGAGRPGTVLLIYDYGV